MRITYSGQTWSGERADDLTGGMGTPPATNKHLQKILEREPELVTWSFPTSEVTLIRGPARKLGIKVHTFQGKHETYTVVTKVKDECRVSHGKLRVFDRIVCINNYETIHDKESQILNLLSTAAGQYLKLSISHPERFWTVPDTCKLNLNIPVYQSETNNGHDSVNGCVVDEVSLRARPEGCSTCTGTNGNACEDSCTIKRGISQVSGSSNNSQSTCSTLSADQKADIMGKSKGDKLVKKFYKSPSQDNNDNCEELEPLKTSEAFGAGGHGKMDSKYSNFQVEPERAISLPGQKDIAVSMQDIVFFEDQAQSLPVVHQIASHAAGPTTSCPCATCVVTAELCDNCGNKPSCSPRKPRSPGIPLIPESMEGLGAEDYGNFLLKNPHLALWDGANTHVVEIDKGPAAEFGFSYKVKIGKNQDASVEIYTLVETLVKGGPAFGKLKIGDWIRSVNGTPIQVPMDAFSLLSNSTKEKTKRLVIQRPVSFSQQIGSSSSPPPPRGDKGEKSAAQEFSVPPPVVSPPFTLSPRELQDPLLPDSPLPGGVEPKKTNSKSEKKAPRKIYIPSTTQSSASSDAELGIPSFPKVVKLPKVKIFICGGEAMSCLSLIFRDSKIDLDFQKSSYSIVDCSMATNSFGSIVISPSCSNLFSASVSQSNLSIASMDQSDSNSRSSDSKCKHCGNEFNLTSSHSLVGTVANAEIYVVPDDKLFHNCCTYLFTKSSIFILTFDGAKLLRSVAGEITRLQNLSHTIRSVAGYDCHIMSCGLLEKSSDPRSTADEVQTLFYTSLVNQLQNYNVTGPELITYSSSLDTESDAGCQQIQTAIWQAVMETIQRQHVLQPSLVVMDYLAAVRDRDAFLTESQLMDVVKQKLPTYQQDIHQMVLTDLITSAEIISEKAAPITVASPTKAESLVVINPRILLDMFHNVILAVTEDKQRWTRVHSTGCVKAEEFMEMCTDVDNLRRAALQFLECYGLIFRRYPTQVRQAEYYLPYFALVPSSSGGPQPEKKDHVLCLQFKEHETTQVFFQLMFGLASQCDTPDSITTPAVNCCSFCHQGVVVTGVHHKLEDRVKFICRSCNQLSRGEKSSSIKLPDLYRWLLWGCRKTLAQEVHFQLAAPCPLGDACRTSTAPALHLVDLKEPGPQYCGAERIDTHKAVRAWRPRDAVVSPVAASAPAKPDVTPRLVLELPWSVFSRVCLKLKVSSPLDRDWKGLAGLMGYTVEDVQLYETVDNPPKVLLREWSQSRNATITDLLQLLRKLDREDIVTDITQALDKPSGQTVDKPAKSSTDVVTGHAAEKPSRHSSNSAGQAVENPESLNDTDQLQILHPNML